MTLDPNGTLTWAVHPAYAGREAPVVVDIEDEGDRFDIDANTRDASAPENLEREDGRGLFLMRALMDQVERFDASPGTERGNVVRLTMARE